eukprot:scaffold3600_cov171-Amphora_coffeaeformis.AAC.16
MTQRAIGSSSEGEPTEQKICEIMQLFVFVWTYISDDGLELHFDPEPQRVLKHRYDMMKKNPVSLLV